MHIKTLCLNLGYSPDIFLEVLNEITKIQSGWQITWLEFQHQIPRVWTAMFVVRQKVCCSFFVPVESSQINAFKRVKSNDNNSCFTCCPMIRLNTFPSAHSAFKYRDTMKRPRSFSFQLLPHLLSQSILITGAGNIIRSQLLFFMVIIYFLW